VPEACADVLPTYPVVAESFFAALSRAVLDNLFGYFAMAFTIIDERNISGAPHFQWKFFRYHKKRPSQTSPAWKIFKVNA